MALVRPSLPTTIALDAGYDNEITFGVYGGTQYSGYEVQIYNNETKVLHFTASKTTYSNKFNIEANILANGVEYQFKVRTFKIDETTEDYSEWSDPMVIKCYTTPTCSIDNLVGADGERVINNQNYIFEGTYYQAENVLMKSYQFILYDENKNELQEFATVYQTTNSVSQKVEGFSPKADYYIELVCIDQYDLKISTGLIAFSVEYEAPRIRQRVDLENEKETASVKISSNMIQIIFKVDNEPPVFINEQELDLTNNRAYLDEQLNLTGNFTMKFYVRNLPHVDIGVEDYFMTLTSIDESVKICMKESGGRIHVYKILTPKPNGSDVVSHYMSPVIEGYVPETSALVIQINHVNRRIDVYAQVIEVIA